MGNTSSDVNDSIKAQAGGEGGPEIYNIVNLNGGGVLIGLWKQAVTTKNFEELDNYIKNDLYSWMYNDGNMDDIPIETLVRKRIGNKTAKEVEDKEKKTKRLCWKVEKLGAVGETLLHICMLSGNIELAKRLLNIHPNMINDIYLSEDYYGENALHMAIVAEDPLMVRFLLMKGADLHQRASGKFFVPDDQKNSQENVLNDETPIFSVDTNYVGNAYFGEYPLSFAAILNQKECVRLLIAKGADPNKQDFNGNTVLHMLVIYDNLPMFEMMLEFNASLDIKNRQKLTPLTLAAKLARKELFFYILERKRKVWFSYADISCGSYPLDTLDTIAEDGSTDTKSAIWIIANEESVKHLDLLEGLIVELIYKKWDSYISQRFYFEFIFFMIHFGVAMACVIMKRSYFVYLEHMECLAHTISEDGPTYLSEGCRCAYLYPSDKNRYIRTAFEILSLVFSATYVIIFCIELYIQKLTLFLQTIFFNPAKIFFMISLFTTFLIVPMRFTCNVYAEDILVSLTIICNSLFILYLARGFRRISTFIFIIHTMIGSNLNKWSIIFFFMMMGFSQAFYVTTNFGNAPSNFENYFSSAFQSLVDTFVCFFRASRMAYKNIQVSDNAIVGRFWLIIFLILVGVIMFFLTISMMMQVCTTTSYFKREYLRQWSRQVLTIEKNISAKQRLKQQRKYAYISNNGEKFFIVRWKQTKAERQELKSNLNLVFNQTFDETKEL